ncbi:MAG: hypothetical protein QM771_16230 [Nitrospira sp.]
MLGVGEDEINARGQNRGPSFWQLAWDEVRRSRGEAIQTGVQEQELIEEQLLVILRKLMAEIRETALAGESFGVAIPTGHDVKGRFLFRKVRGIEEGFAAPESELKVIHQLSLIDQWRD